MNDYKFILPFNDIKNNDQIDLISAFKGLIDVYDKEEILMSKNNKKDEEIKEVKVEAPVEEKKAEPVKETAKNDVKNPPVQKGKKRVNVYANGVDIAYITYPFTGVKKGIVLDLEDIKKLCWHKVPVEEIKADGTIVKLTLENYDK